MAGDNLKPGVNPGGDTYKNNNMKEVIKNGKRRNEKIIRRC